MVFGDGPSLYDAQGRPAKTSRGHGYVPPIRDSPGGEAVQQFLVSGDESRAMSGSQLRPNAELFYKSAWKYSSYHHLPVKVSRRPGRPYVYFEYKERAPVGSKKTWLEYYTKRGINIDDEKST